MVEITKEMVDKFSSLYISYRGRYVRCQDGKMFVPKVRNSDKTLTITNRVVVGHLAHNYSIAIYAGPSASKFVCFDVDVNDKELVRKLVGGLSALGFPRDRVYVSASGGKGFHVEIFFTDLMYTELLQDLYRTICFNLDLDRRKVEFRPTHRQAVKLPLSIHCKTGNMCWYLDPDTLEPIEDADYVFQIQPVDRDWAVELIQAGRKDIPEEVDIPRTAVRVRPGTDGLPVLTEEGTRHDLMVGIAVAERYAGLDQEDIADRLLSWANNQNQALIKSSRGEVVRDAEEIAAWVCGPSFRQADAEVFLTDADIEIISSLRGQTRRRTLFVIIAFCRKYRTAVLSARRIAGYVGASERGVVKAVDGLRSAGLVSCETGKCFIHDGKVGQAPNRYTYAGADGKHIPLDWDFKENTFEETYEKIMSTEENKANGKV